MMMCEGISSNWDSTHFQTQKCSLDDGTNTQRNCIAIHTFSSIVKCINNTVMHANVSQKKKNKRKLHGGVEETDLSNASRKRRRQPGYDVNYGTTVHHFLIFKFRLIRK